MNQIFIMHLASVIGYVILWLLKYSFYLFIVLSVISIGNYIIASLLNIINVDINSDDNLFVAKFVMLVLLAIAGLFVANSIFALLKIR